MFPVYLDTDNSVSTNPANARFNIDMTGERPFTSATITSVTFCNAQSAFPARASQVVFTVSATPYTLTIPSNNYSGTSLATYLASQMTAVGPDTYTVTYDTDALKFTFVTSGTIFEFTPTANDAYRQLGITTTGVANTTIVSDQLVRLDGFEFVDLETDIKVARSYTSNTNVNLIARIPLNVPYGSIVFYEPPEPIIFSIASRENTVELDLRLKAPDGYLYELPESTNVIYTVVFQ